MNYWAIFALVVIVLSYLKMRDGEQAFAAERSELWQQIRELEKENQSLRDRSLRVARIAHNEAEAEQDQDRNRSHVGLPGGRRGPRAGFSQVKRQMETQEPKRSVTV